MLARKLFDSLKKRKKKEKNCGGPLVQSGFYALQGKRPSMEDACIVIDVLNETYPVLAQKRYSFYGIYDGHAGRDAANLCEVILHQNIVLDDAFSKGEFHGAIRNGFEKTDRIILETSQKEAWKNGTTAVISLIVENELFVANIGDSEVVLAKKRVDCVTNEILYEPVVLSEIHRPNIPKEKQRIQEAGGSVVFGRLFGDLAVSRAFGDSDYKIPKAQANFIICEPFLQSVQLKPEDEFLILACDGLWDKLSYKDAVEFVVREKNRQRNALEISQLLANEALRRNSNDNVTVILVFFQWEDEPRKSRSKEKKQK